MRYLFILFTIIAMASCTRDGDKTNTPDTDSTRHADSVRQHEEDEVSEELIKESFDALNR